MASTSLKMNTSEIFQLNSNVSASNEEITSHLNAINMECMTLGSYIQSAGIQAKINYIADLIGEIQLSFNSNMAELVTFLNNQLKGYETTTEEATKLLRQALEFIQENFVNNIG